MAMSMPLIITMELLWEKIVSIIMDERITLVSPYHAVAFGH